MDPKTSAVTLTVALLATLLPAAAAAAIVDGRPGSFVMVSMTIDATSNECRARYEDPVEGNTFIRGEDAVIRVVSNRNGAHATCRFADISGVIEANAEVGHTTACTLVTNGGEWSEGAGRVTSAANIGDESAGGNSVIVCHFRITPPSARVRSEPSSSDAGPVNPRPSVAPPRDDKPSRPSPGSMREASRKAAKSKAAHPAPADEAARGRVKAKGSRPSRGTDTVVTSKGRAARR